jgi:hypothetical protein
LQQHPPHASSLQPENLLYTSHAEDADIKIADFGLAKLIKREDLMTTQCGTPGYVGEFEAQRPLPALRPAFLIASSSFAHAAVSLYLAPCVQPLRS